MRGKAVCEMRDLFFCPERWAPDEMISTNAAQAIRVRGFSGRTVDAWQLGDFGSDWTAITSQIPMETGWLEAGAQYRFCFWLNGGENSRGGETCMLEIFGDAWEDRLRFRLNRNHTKPLLEKNHWLLYAIPFTAPEAAKALNFRFVAAGAVCTIAGIPDMDMAACESLTTDQPDTAHSFRHNLWYPHGWPEERPLPQQNEKISLRKKAAAAAAVTAVFAIGAVALRQYLKKKR